MQISVKPNTENLKPVELTGGESVYCINYTQMGRAKKLLESAPADSPMTLAWKQIQDSLDRNEKATIAFMLIDELNK